MERLRNTNNIPLLYAALYSEVLYDLANYEMEFSMFMNKHDIELVSVVLKHKDFLFEQNAESLLSLLKSLKGKFNNRQQLEVIIKMMSDVYDVKVLNTKLFERKLFIKELPFNGDQVLEIGKRLSQNEGPWVGKVFEKARDYSVMDVDFELEDLVKKCIFN